MCMHAEGVFVWHIVWVGVGVCVCEKTANETGRKTALGNHQQSCPPDQKHARWIQRLLMMFQDSNHSHETCPFSPEKVLKHKVGFPTTKKKSKPRGKPSRSTVRLSGIRAFLDDPRLSLRFHLPTYWLYFKHKTENLLQQKEEQ